MVITPKDVDADLNILMQSIGDKNRPLASPVQALKLSMLWPLSCVSGYIVSMLCTIFIYKPYTNHFGRVVSVFDEYGMSMAFACFSVFFALIIGAGLYTKALVYLSIHPDVRRESIIVSMIKRISLKLGFALLVLNIGLAILALQYPYLLGLAPFVFMISFFVIGYAINSEIARYGLPSLLSKLSKLVKRV